MYYLRFNLLNCATNKTKMIKYHNYLQRVLVSSIRYNSTKPNPNAAHKAKIEWPKRILSGFQPTGAVHIGNYFGSIKNMVECQNRDEDVTLSIVDLHSITLPQDPGELQTNILEMTATLLACGIDPEKSTLFVQSSVSQHAELCWILTCLATIARLSHLPQYKEKSESLKEVPLGLLVYPVLQAADILLHRATHVPVGEDQLQHLQVAQQIVKTFNYRFGNTFPNPLPVLPDESSARIRSLRDPLKKMSKSDPNPKSRILLSDTPEAIKLKIRKAVTDFTPEITYNPETRPGVSNLINIHCLVSDKIPEEVVEENDGSITGHYKSMVADALISYMEPKRVAIERYKTQPDYLKDVLHYGAKKASQTAEKTYSEVCEKVGLGIPSLDKIHAFSSIKN